MEHLLLERNAHTVTISLQDAGRIIEEVIGINDTDLSSFIRASSICRDVAILLLAVHTVFAFGDLGSNLADAAKIFKDAADFVIAGFGRIELVESGNFVERRNRATVVGRDAVMWIADQEGKMEFREKVLGNNGGIVGFAFGRIWEGCRVFSAIFVVAIGLDPVDAIGGFLGANTSLEAHKRRRDLCGLLARWDEVVNDVFDEEPFAL